MLMIESIRSWMTRAQLIPPHPRSPTLDSHADYYDLLSISRDATLADIKSAYHRALLRFHPDKNLNQRHNKVDVALIKEAYNVLSSPDLRAAYDKAWARERHNTYVSRGPRPAQVLSLEEFEEVRDGAEGGSEDEDGPWQYSCRCGGLYWITTALLERGEHLIACSSCSEVVWVGYELAEQ